MIRPGPAEGSQLQKTGAQATRGDRVCIVLLSSPGFLGTPSQLEHHM